MSNGIHSQIITRNLGKISDLYLYSLSDIAKISID